MNSRMTVSGNIVGELSEKIPSNIIALNELIKNSYDAGASKVSISLDTNTKLLTIADDGDGMNKSDIDTLFHLSNSKKKYGEVNQHGRYTQGSKGLGFLSVFKFGKYVEWKTKKSNGLKFAVNYLDLIKSDDISNFDIEIFEDDFINKGTTITIALDDYNITSLLKYFSEEKNYKKIVNAFSDEKFIIELHINNDNYSSIETLPLKKNYPEKQLYYITYNSQDQKINYYFNNCLIFTKDYAFDSNAYNLDIELLIFQLQPYGKTKIDQLYYKDRDDLTPLIYINNNLFNNFDMFDPNVMKNIKTSQVLNQMVGAIRIISNNALISFNSDRSQFLQNELTDSIKEYLSEMNKTIQIEGSNIKKYLIDCDFLTVAILPEECINAEDAELRKYIKSDFAFKAKVAINKTGNTVSYSLFNKVKVINIKEKKITPDKSPENKNSNNSDETQNNAQAHTNNGDTEAAKKSIPAIINLKCKEKKLSIPSEQIDLRNEITSVFDSNGKAVDINLVDIKIDGKLIISKILSSVLKPHVIHIEYSYVDKITGVVAEILVLTFYQQESGIKSKENSIMLITLPSSESYSINYNIFVGKLITEINSLDIVKYKEVIACSMRAIFDISIDTINKSTKYQTLLKTSKFEDRVIEVIEHISKTKAYKTEISKSTRIDYHSLENMLDPDTFRSGISTAHLGAHKATSYISDNEIMHLAKLIGIFVVIINEMLNNPSIN